MLVFTEEEKLNQREAKSMLTNVPPSAQKSVISPFPTERVSNLTCAEMKLTYLHSVIPTMYEGKVFSVPGSGRCVKGPSSTPRWSICSNSFAYRFRFFLPIVPVPVPEGSHSFLIQRAHLCRSINTGKSL